MDELTKSIQEDISWCMMFDDDIMLMDETQFGVKARLEVWRQTLEIKGFKLSRSKIGYMEYKFGGGRSSSDTEITLDGEEIPIRDMFCYLGSIIQRDGELDGNVSHRIKAGWMEWKIDSGFLCDRGMPNRLKGKFYRTSIRHALMYGVECWAVKQCHFKR
ncbi:unnamed protein product [Cuscuta europaea]|uniref:Reverse transcriptase domain-containing protein n=1 Tax=Cuscuta europaea TaxID=41803 RepID=A0A9P1E8V1_CUSEU|nr:unnamed protein product [Cuscuta europaea]